MKSKTIGAVAVLMMALAAGCGKNAGPTSTAANGPAGASPANVAASGEEASIRAAIQERLTHQRNLNLESFDTDVKQVSIQGGRAQAQVEFHIKGGPGMMQMTYALEKRDGAWSVVDSEPAGDNVSHPLVDGSAASTGAPNAMGAPVDPMSDPARFFKSVAPVQPAPPHP